MEMDPIIQVTDLEEMDSGVISCSVTVNGMEYVSESIELVVVEGTCFEPGACHLAGMHLVSWEVGMRVSTVHPHSIKFFTS